MYSSFNPWEFKQNYPQLLTEGKFGPYAFSCYDPYLEKIFFNSIPKHFIEGGWKVIAGPEVSVSWLEDNLATLDFFSTHQSYKVLLSEQMSPQAKEFLLKENIEWGNRFFLLSFSKEDKFYEKCKKTESFNTLKVSEPRFWENGKLMKFLCETTGVSLSFEIQNFILDTIENTPGELILAIKKLALSGIEPRRLTVQDVALLLTQSKIDQFDLARRWGDKRLTSFYKKLLSLSEDYDGMRSFFGFMQGHAVKMLDPSYIRAKSKPSKYDKQIESQAQSWSKADLADELQFFGECEVLAKAKSQELTQKLRLRVIETY